MKTETYLVRKFHCAVTYCPRCGLSPVEVTSDMPDYPRRFRFECPECGPAGLGFWEFSHAAAADEWNKWVHWKRIANSLPAWFQPAGQSLVHPSLRDSDGGAVLTRGQT